MVLMAGYDLPVRAIREQVASALDLILQVSRLPDGRRVITQVTELQGMEGDVILLQDLFTFRPVPGAPGAGELVSNGLRPKFMDRLAEIDIEVPASAFRSASAASDRLAAAGIRNGKKVRIPSERELADRETLR
jgi:pilus assembly protein CpaF